MISIPGDIMEGGGQVLRFSVALSSVARKQIKVHNIRANRTPSGLRRQHLNAVKAVARLSNAQVEGASLGSKEIFFTPSHIEGGSFNIDVETAGSTSLILQAMMPVAAFADKIVAIEIIGGTNNPMAPPIDYIQKVLLPTIAKMGFRGSIDLLRRGFYPKGQGIIRAEFEPVRDLKPIILTNSGDVKKLYCISYSARLQSHIVERMAKSAKTALYKSGYKDVNTELESLQSNDSKCAVDPGCGIMLLAELTSGSFLSSSIIGKLGKSAENVGEEAAKNLLMQLESKAPIDKFLADQIIIYISLADGVSRIRTTELTLHTLTCVEIAKRILGVDFTVDGGLGEPATISCKGIGYKKRMT